MSLRTRLPDSDATLRIRPAPDASRCGRAQRIMLSGALQLTAQTASSDASSASRIVIFDDMPALFTSASMRPKRRAAASTQAAWEAQLSAA